MIIETLFCMAVAVDGDTFRCGGERFRLLGIDAPETAEHQDVCYRGRRCAPGDPVRSTENLKSYLNGRPLQVIRVGSDKYGRTIAVLYSNRKNVNCAQVSSGNAIYRPDWDNQKILRTECPAVAH